LLQNEDVAEKQSSAAHHGISLFTAIGVAVAVQISWSINESIGWAIFHGFLNWIYVIYRWLIQAGWL
jgi:hypothetical protein